MTELRALRPVARATLRTGRGSLLGPATSRRTHWWKLRLSCGHLVERRARYRPLPGHPGSWPRSRSASDVVPAPRRARCDQCTALFHPADPELSDGQATLPVLDRTIPSEVPRS